MRATCFGARSGRSWITTRPVLSSRCRVLDSGASDMVLLLVGGRGRFVWTQGRRVLFEQRTKNICYADAAPCTELGGRRRPVESFWFFFSKKNVFSSLSWDRTPAAF